MVGTADAMAQEKPSKLSEWGDAIRAHAPEVRRAAGVWVERVREEPLLLWEPPAVRYAVYVLGAIVAIWLINFAMHAIAPPLPVAAGPEATTADFHVICSNAACGRHFVIHKNFGFKGFPVECPFCKQKTGLRAVPCTADKCTQQWVLPPDVP